jgi:protein involved in sex pheromone biosynthesis
MTSTGHFQLVLCLSVCSPILQSTSTGEKGRKEKEGEKEKEIMTFYFLLIRKIPISVLLSV